jgi:Ca-activated chloride channel family protein
MSFHQPYFLLGLLLVPVLVWAYVAHQRGRERAGAAFVSGPLRASVIRWQPGWRRHLPVGLAGAGLAILLVALAQPERTVAVPAEQARVILVTDTSGSMQATDVAPTRLDAVKKAANNFIDNVPKKVRIGAVVFNQNATLAQTPTLERDAVRGAINAMQPSGGTATGDALQTALNALKSKVPGQKAPPAAIVLLSDGASTSGSDPVTVARTARRMKVPIYTVALGTDQGTIQVRQHGGGLKTENVPPDPDTMAQIAQVSGGKTYSSTTSAELNTVYKKLGSQVALKDEKRQITAWLAGAALALLVVSTLPSLRWFARPV